MAVIAEHHRGAVKGVLGRDSDLVHTLDRTAILLSTISSGSRGRTPAKVRARTDSRTRISVSLRLIADGFLNALLAAEPLLVASSTAAVPCITNVF